MKTRIHLLPPMRETVQALIIYLSEKGNTGFSHSPSSHTNKTRTKYTKDELSKRDQKKKETYSTDNARIFRQKLSENRT